MRVIYTIPDPDHPDDFTLTRESVVEGLEFVPRMGDMIEVGVDHYAVAHVIWADLELTEVTVVLK
ncbi:hypothetical protein SEA_APHELION_154 [Gordonia phage Aphelion]|uniref:Uncharacterized protein n=1 Tax=Gordonia phage Aphelion TaxID=2507860 RepID=A0A410TDB3_9CAUD|nr:hypothetical protein SEA_APHELION_154 [Gordonia phage Aphelion]